MKEFLVWLYMNCADTGKLDYHKACVYALERCRDRRSDCLKWERDQYYAPVGKRASYTNWEEEQKEKKQRGIPHYKTLEEYKRRGWKVEEVHSAGGMGRYYIFKNGLVEK